ncbi:MAG TPA: cupin domain-containing protein [Bacteriovoracaceae bacterium]|nr:cupin domain-containing protein [Bacteriovoracaceae bacterium]
MKAWLILSLSLLTFHAFADKGTLKDQIKLSDKGKTVKVLSQPSFKLIGLGLKKDQILEKHTTPTIAVLIVQSGAVDFKISGKTHLLKAGDYFEIPANIEHEVISREDSLLYLVR